MGSKLERRLMLAPQTASVPVARHFARDLAVEWGVAELGDDIALGTTELVTNAVKHVGTDVELIVRLDGSLTVEVRDGGDELMHPVAPAASDAASGRGLKIVAAISTDWGVTSLARGKAVWFRLNLPDRGGRDADVVNLSAARDAAEAAAGERGSSGAGGRPREDRAGSG